MMSSRTTLLRSSRAVRQISRKPLQQKPNARFQSTSSSSASSGNPALTGALAGGLTTIVVGYTYYHFSGLKTLSQTATQTKEYLSSAQKKLTEQAPNSSEAVRWLKQVSTYYAGFVPGARGVVDSVWDDLEAAKGKHGEEFDKVISEAYDELKDVIGKGEVMSMAGAAKAWDVIQKYVMKLEELVEDAAGDILDNHPEVKAKLGGSVDQLKSLGQNLGPEAKKQVDETWAQISDIGKSGFSADNIEKIRKVVQEKVEALKKMADEAWSKGMEKAKPYLDKNPKVKELVEQNADALKQGNFQELYQKIENAVKSGSTEDLEKYVKGAGEKAKEAASSVGGGGLEQYLKMLPGGEQIGEQLSRLQEVAQKHGKEAEKLLQDTVKEMKDVLEKKSEEAKKIAEQAKKEGGK